MATCNPLFLAIYATIVAGIIFCTFVILSSVYTSLPAAGAGDGGNEKYFPSPKVTGTPRLQREPSDMFTRAIWDVPVDSKMPGMKSFLLTKEMVKHRAKDNIIIVTFGNHAFLDFILNWVKHLTDLNIFNILVGAMDTKLLEALYWKGIPVFDMGSKMVTVDVGWGSAKFHKMGREKVLLINALLPFGYELLMCDTDMVWLKAMPQQLKLEPYAVHTTFQFAGSDGKRHRLREAMLFYDQPAYYDTPGGFLSFKPGIPKSLLLDGPHTLQSHFSLVNYQLRQIRTALAVACLLNRTLVMPPLWCRFERMWFGHPGILEGTLTKQPFVCPMDHLFEIHTMLHGLSEEEFGPQIHFREYSFLQNPSVPKHVKESLLNVQLCDAHSKGCNISDGTTSRGFIQFPRNSTEQMYMQVFSQYKDIKVLHFSSMANAFQGFNDEAREVKFRNRMKRYVGLWCCVENRDLGHIYYDIYWDEKPEWKPEPPRTSQDDHPPWD
ncbi:arabinosyltransferase XEG113-like isoform X3 [Musa acuminata AAA Group]|uniref:arabinosyltransferase XEG113-like isoform X3 n=1 Tax=Musa acuminata AAA Group TaxID=214697 RepID=UPI0031D26DCA